VTVEHKLSTEEEIELLTGIAKKYQENYEQAVDMVAAWQKHKEHAAEMLRKVRGKLRELGFVAE
jgi:hypothetical protein